MKNLNDLPQTADADISAEKLRSKPCENIVSHGLVQKVSDEAISPAVSPSVSPSTDENYKTESDGSQYGNQSGSKSNEKPNCYECKHRRSVPGDAHSECVNPRISETDRLVTGFALMAGQRSSAMKRLNVSANPHGIKRGWFYWPLNFDPVWLDTCDGFEK